MAQQELSRCEVLTLNTWGLWLVSKDRRVRMQEFGRFLTTTKADIVLLQEVWVQADAEHLLACGRQAGLSYGMHFKSGIFGSGLVTMSRYPIKEAGFQRYSASGDAVAVHCGDFFAGKGVGWLRLALPQTDCVVFNTHLHANYSHKCSSLDSVDIHGKPSKQPQQPGTNSLPSLLRRRTNRSETMENQRIVAKDGPGPVAEETFEAPVSLSTPGALHYMVPQDDFAAYRVSQMCELAQVIRQVVSSACLGNESCAVILAGDLNTKPHFLEMQLLRHLLPELTDSWTAVHGCQSESAGHTCRAPGSTYKSTRQVPERIDYIFTAGMTPLHCSVELQRSPAGCSYSDHHAVKAVLSVSPKQTNTAANSTCLPVFKPLGGNPLSLYATPGQRLSAADQSETSGAPVDAAGLQQLALHHPETAVLHGMADTMSAAVDILTWGIAINTTHAKQRLQVAVTLILAAIILCILAGWEQCGAGNDTRVHVIPRVSGCTVLVTFTSLCAAISAAFGILLACIGGIADVTQAQVLKQSRDQLQIRFAAVQELLKADKHNA